MLPQDPGILLSYVNTQLRDHYASLEDLCKSLGAERRSLEETLAKIDYTYDKGTNQFV